MVIMGMVVILGMWWQIVFDSELAKFGVANHYRSQPVAKIRICQKVLSFSQHNCTITVKKLRNHPHYDRLERHPTQTSFQRLALPQRNRCSLWSHSLADTGRANPGKVAATDESSTRLSTSRHSFFPNRNAYITLTRHRSLQKQPGLWMLLLG